MTRWSGVARSALLVVLLLRLPAALHAQDTSSELKRRVEQLRATGALQAAGATISASDALYDAYEQYGFQPLWPAGPARTDLLAAIRGADQDGLVAAHYHHDILAVAAAAPGLSAAALDAELDLVRTQALIRLVGDLRHGRTRSHAAPAVTAAALRDHVSTGRIEALVAAARPAHFVYDGLRAALEQLRDLRAAGGWPTVPDGPAMRLDSTDVRVPVLRRRLVLSGDLPAGPGATGRPDRPEAADTSIVFDAALHAAVVRFQHRHGLNEDGVVGPRTRAELNVPVETRIDQVRINLERARWVLHDLADTFVAVNVAGAMVYYVRDGVVVHEARAIVGRPYTATPVFSASMQYIDVNPTWTVPPGIVGEVLSAIRRDAGYLRAQNMTVLDHSGRIVAASSIDFGRYSARTFPYVFRQEPGPLNPLGSIKFMFPNRHNVYLHDTPGRGLFEQEDRLFSHGCIRISNPFRLAELLLEGTAWSRARLEAEAAERVTRTIRLPTPVPVLILYWTASTDLHHELHFYRDVYGRDQDVLRGLDTP
jgi:L,D-transpeptidase YcbB